MALSGLFQQPARVCPLFGLSTGRPRLLPTGARMTAVEHRYESWRITNYLEEAVVARVWFVMRERRWEGMEKNDDEAITRRGADRPARRDRRGGPEPMAGYSRT